MLLTKRAAEAFSQRIFAALLKELKAIAKKGRLTLVYAARDELHNEAVMLRDVLAH